MAERDLAEELEKLNIRSVECSGVYSKADVFSGIDAIKAHMALHPDSEKIAHFKESRLNRANLIKAESIK